VAGEYLCLAEIDGHVIGCNVNQETRVPRALHDVAGNVLPDPASHVAQPAMTASSALPLGALSTFHAAAEAASNGPPHVLSTQAAECAEGTMAGAAVAGVGVGMLVMEAAAAAADVGAGMTFAARRRAVNITSIARAVGVMLARGEQGRAGGRARQQDGRRTRIDALPRPRRNALRTRVAPASSRRAQCDRGERGDATSRDVQICLVISRVDNCRTDFSRQCQKAFRPHFVARAIAARRSATRAPTLDASASKSIPRAGAPCHLGCFVALPRHSCYNANRIVVLHLARSSAPFSAHPAPRAPSRCGTGAERRLGIIRLQTR
jgi:hypothetical protein